MEDQHIIDQNNENQVKKKRPISITVVCVLGLLGFTIAIPTVFTNVASRVGDWYPPFLGASSIVGFVCMYGLWQMKKWAAYLYTGLFIFNQIIMYTMGLWSAFSLILPLIVVAIVLSNINEME